MILFFSMGSSMNNDRPKVIELVGAGPLMNPFGMTSFGMPMTMHHKPQVIEMGNDPFMDPFASLLDDSLFNGFDLPPMGTSVHSSVSTSKNGGRPVVQELRFQSPGVHIMFQGPPSGFRLRGGQKTLSGPKELPMQSLGGAFGGLMDALAVPLHPIKPGQKMVLFKKRSSKDDPLHLDRFVDEVLAHLGVQVGDPNRAKAAKAQAKVIAPKTGPLLIDGSVPKDDEPEVPLTPAADEPEEPPKTPTSSTSEAPVWRPAPPVCANESADLCATPTNGVLHCLAEHAPYLSAPCKQTLRSSLPLACREVIQNTCDVYNEGILPCLQRQASELTGDCGETYKATLENIKKVEETIASGATVVNENGKERPLVAEASDSYYQLFSNFIHDEV